MERAIVPAYLGLAFPDYIHARLGACNKPKFQEFGAILKILCFHYSQLFLDFRILINNDSVHLFRDLSALKLQVFIKTATFDETT